MLFTRYQNRDNSRAQRHKSRPEVAWFDTGVLPNQWLIVTVPIFDLFEVVEIVMPRPDTCLPPKYGAPLAVIAIPSPSNLYVSPK